MTSYESPSKKATGLGGICIRILKEALLAISASLADVYNASISSSVFPDAFKLAKLTSIHKKRFISCDDKFRTNFHPADTL